MNTMGKNMKNSNELKNILDIMDYWYLIKNILKERIFFQLATLQLLSGKQNIET